MQDTETLQTAATADLAGVHSVADLAAQEGFAADAFTVALAKRIGVFDVPFNQQIARLQALAGIATNISSDSVTADELSKHYLLTFSLFERFSMLAADCATNGKTRAAGVYMNAAASAQRASLAVLNALESLRQQSKQPKAMPLSG
jgi:hypothetical protein